MFQKFLAYLRIGNLGYRVFLPLNTSIVFVTSDGILEYSNGWHCTPNQKVRGKGKAPRRAL